MNPKALEYYSPSARKGVYRGEPFSFQQKDTHREALINQLKYGAVPEIFHMDDGRVGIVGPDSGACHGCLSYVTSTSTRNAKTMYKAK